MLPRLSSPGGAVSQAVAYNQRFQLFDGWIPARAPAPICHVPVVRTRTILIPRVTITVTRTALFQFQGRAPGWL